LKQKKDPKSKSGRKPAVGFKDMTSHLTKSIPIKATAPAKNSDPSPSKSRDADNEDSSELESESESEIGEEVLSGMEEDDDGPAEPPEDEEFNVDNEVDIDSPILRKIIGQDLTTATASKTTDSHQLVSVNTSFEMNDDDFNNLWES
jgi:hypothetical protein